MDEGEWERAYRVASLFEIDVRGEIKFSAIGNDETFISTTDAQKSEKVNENKMKLHEVWSTASQQTRKKEWRRIRVERVKANRFQGAMLCVGVWRWCSLIDRMSF